MPNPVGSDQYVDQLMTDMSVAYVQKDTAFAAHRAAPIVPVKLQGGLFAKYDKGDFNRLQMAKRADGKPAAQGGYRTDNSGTYFCHEYALDVPIGRQERANAVPPYDPARDKTLFLTQQGLINRESIFAANAMGASIWSGQTDQAGVAAAPGANEFLRFDAAGSDPIAVLESGLDAVRTATGKRPNQIVLGAAVWKSLKNHADIVDRIKHVSAEVVKAEIVASLLELEKGLVVSGAVKTNSNEGQTDTLADIVGKSLLMHYVEENPGVMNPSAVQTFAWSEFLGGDKGGGQIKRWYENTPDAEIVRIQQAFDVKVVAADLGAFYSAVVS